MSTTPSDSAGLFEKMKSFAARTRKLRLAHPDDVLEERPVFAEGEQEQAIREGRKPRPERVTLAIREGAETLDFEVAAIPDVVKERAERILDRAVAPKLYVEQPGDKPGQPSRQVFAGYNEEDPGYLAELREARLDQAAMVAMHGTRGLMESLPGQEEADKIKALRENLPQKMIGWLAAEIWGMTYAGGDLADFFTKGSSPESPS